MSIDPNPVIDALRDEWNGLSRKNAFHYIKSTRPFWQEDDFLASGEQDVREFVDPFLARHSLMPSEMRMLEVGCGVGRMTLALARRFAFVEAADIASEMIARAEDRRRKLAVENARFQVVSGRDLQPYADQSIDFCFSFIVFQHIPDVAVVLNYVREMGRVLKPGGRLLFQVNGFYSRRFFGDQFLYWGICETGRLRKLGIRSKPCLRFGKLNSWDGVPISVTDLQDVCRSAGISGLEFRNIGTQYMWVSGRKSS